MKKVVIIGAARQGTALAQYLWKNGHQVVINDQRDEEQLVSTIKELEQFPIEWVLGDHPLSLLENCELICPSGGVPQSLPLLQEARSRGIRFTNDSQIFLEVSKSKVVGITGSAGKSTTTTLVGNIAQMSIDVYSEKSRYKNSWYGGNLGTPLITYIDDVQEDDLSIMELSSFQLEIMTKSPQIAAILNVTPNHLDRHKTMAAYIEAKSNIIKYQGKNSSTVLNRDDPISWGFNNMIHGNLISFGVSAPGKSHVGSFIKDDNIYMQTDSSVKLMFSREAIKLRGEHNVNNVLASIAISYAAGLPLEAIEQTVREYSGVEHRLEFVRNWKGADWYNDSIATAPERAVAAIRAFDEPIILLAGGRDKDLPWNSFIESVRKRVKHIILFGEMAEMVANELYKGLEESQSELKVSICGFLGSAVSAAAQFVKPGDVVLLAPGGTSFDEFSDFAERGDQFKQMVNAL